MTDAMKAATSFIMKVAKNPEAYPEKFVAIRRDAIAKIMSGERTRLLDLLEEKGPFPEMRLLAKALKRRPGAVARDVKDLEAWGLVVRKRHGRRVLIAATDRPVLVI